MNLTLSENYNLKPVFGMAREGQVFLYGKTYYLKVAFDKAAKIGVVDDKLKDKSFRFWERVKFDPEYKIDKIYTNVDIIFE